MIYLIKRLYLIIFLLFSSLAYAESPPLLSSPYPYVAYINSFNTNTFEYTECKGSLISESWVLTHSKCIKGKNYDITVKFDVYENQVISHQVQKVFKFKNKKMALLHLSQPTVDISPVKLLRNPLLPENGKFTAHILHSSFFSEQDEIQAVNRKKLSHQTESSLYTKASNGGPWIIKTQSLGNVQVGFSLNTNKAMQTARLAKAIDKVIQNNSGESAQWVNRQTLFDNIACDTYGICVEPPQPPCFIGSDDCVTPPVIPECPEGAADCGLPPCVISGEPCVEPPVIPECPEDAADCGLPPCVLAGEICIEPYVIKNK